ncbi:MAG: ATP-binding protein [Hespellia sp.]|nr:ATP-binding protein [Hespellia sp.]
MKEKKKRSHSLFKKIIIPLIVVMLLQSGIFFGATFYGGISDTLNQNAEDVLTERVINQQRNLETKFITQWTNFSASVGSIGQIYEQVTNNLEEPIYHNAELQKSLLSQVSPTLVSMLRSNEVTGAFLILNDEKEYRGLDETTPQNRYGICIRDYSPLSEHTVNEDLLVTRCPSSQISSIGCAMDTGWDAKYTFDEKVPGNYYYKPLQMAYENPGVDYRNLAYFDGVHNFGGTDRMAVSYSVPLIDSKGYPYGVLGIELTTDYLKTLIPASTLYGSNAGSYVLVQYVEGEKQYHVIAYDGVQFQRCFGEAGTIESVEQTDKILKFKSTEENADIRGSLRDVQIYNHNTPYEKEHFALIGMVRADALYGINVIVRRRLLMVSALVLLFGWLMAFLISRRLTIPINTLSQKVSKMDGSAVMELERLNIDEIDELVESIEELKDKVNRTAIRTEFFSRMSHDMRTPMNAIIGFSSRELLEKADKEALLDYMDKIHSSGGYLLSLINEVLDMAKIETERMELREEPITQERLLMTVVPMIDEIAKKKNVRFVVDVKQSETVFYCDSQHLGQVLMNLLSNAVKFTEPGGEVQLSVREIFKDEKTVTTQIEVQDNGCGMSEEFQKKMYEPFSQEGQKSGGTGLGLSIARQMVTLMGGTMECRSEKGRGTIFLVELTNRLDLDAEAMPNAENASEPEQKEKAEKLAGKRVLLCEDHPMNAQIARHLLERVGIQVEEAANGAVGLEMFEKSAEGSYDLILMDIRMPELDGLEATRRIRMLERKDAKKVPIIAMTANAFKEDVEESRSAGMNEHLSKPIDPKILYITLERYLLR